MPLDLSQKANKNGMKTDGIFISEKEGPSMDLVKSRLDRSMNSLALSKGMKIIQANSLDLRPALMRIFKVRIAKDLYQVEEADNSTTESSFRINLDNLLNILTENGPLHNGFFKTTVGRSSGKIYGLVQCRGDVSAENCANCARESVAVALHNCSESKKVQVWFTWCFLRYSNEHFFGVWDQSSMARVNDTNFDNASIVSKGLIFMSEVAITAPKQSLMFQTAVLDAGQFGKRYGMAQCTRDIGRTDCSKCLDTQLVTFRTTIGNKRGWEVYGSSCSMWYHDYQFFSNISIPTNDGARRASLHGVAIGMIMAVLVFLFVS